MSIFNNVTLYLFGAGGHARELSQLIYHHESTNYQITAVVKELNENINVPFSKKVITEVHFNNIIENTKKDVAVVLGIGDPRVRKNIVERYSSYSNIKYPIIAPLTHYLDETINISEGVVITKNVSLTTNIKLGKHVHLNTASTLCHDVKIGEYTIISPGAVLCGNVTIGTRCFIGAGAVIKNGVKIIQDTLVGAGAVVVKDILEPGTYVGVPARKLK